MNDAHTIKKMFQRKCVSQSGRQKQRFQEFKIVVLVSFLPAVCCGM